MLFRVFLQRFVPLVRMSDQPTAPGDAIPGDPAV
jgi:hypothetical protein